MSRPSADRSRYEADQARLLCSLMRGDGYPAGFPAKKADAASRALRHKRARAVARAWPALTHSLGRQFGERFDAYARATPAPASGGGLADGLAFIHRCARNELTEQARVELLLARSVLTVRRHSARRRRGTFLAATLLDHPRRLLIVLRIPAVTTGHAILPLTHRQR